MPLAASFLTVSGVAATRVSPGRVSRGMPINMEDPLLRGAGRPRSAAPGRGRSLFARHRATNDRTLGSFGARPRGRSARSPSPTALAATSCAAVATRSKARPAPRGRACRPAVCGSRGAKAICRGRLCGASRALDPARESASSGGGARSATSSAATVCPHVSSASPNTAAAAMPGQRSSSALHFGRIDVLASGDDEVGAPRVHVQAAVARRTRRGRRCRTMRPARAAARSSSRPSASARAPRCDRRRSRTAGPRQRPAGAVAGRSEAIRVRRRHHLRAGLGEAVGQHDRHAALRRARQQPGRRRRRRRRRTARRCAGGASPDARRARARASSAPATPA